ncbi:threonine--tRNA ligase [Arsenophonus symbiont of Ornithomya chloropus]|uniref:threonine--tRNA ligase n=1 Tax=Arsenophonus symbiont of Ornithomya chloropus TaxID=634121 RepID=UPI0032B1F9D4
MPIITLLNGNQRKYKNSISVMDIAHDINLVLSKECIAGFVNGELVDASYIVDKNAKVLIITSEDPVGLKIIRQSCIFLLGQAIKQLWPSIKLASCNIIKNGFYYDVDLEHSLIEEDLEKIEDKMHELVKKKYNIIKKEVSWKEAKNIFLARNENYKIQFLEKKFEKKKYLEISYYQEYVDISSGPDIPNIRFCNYFKLQKIAGAYWCGNKNNKMLQRIYGTVWSNKKQLDSYLLSLKEAKKRDHRAIAKALDLYHIQDEAPGMTFWHNNGWVIFLELKKMIRSKLYEYQYEEVNTPLMMDRILWEKTGHWENYKENMFVTSSENREYCIKPMNCPEHIQIFNQGLKSYRDLPLRMAEFGSCHRNEPSGALHGLMRVRGFTQDDAHIFCTEQQIVDEVKNCIKMIYDIYSIFGFKKITVKLSTRPKKRIGTDIQWDRAESDLAIALANIPFSYEKGEGAFYGPKIEFTLYDCLDRAWQCGTVQLDFSLPSCLNAFYIDEHNERKIPVMIHRAVLGSLERFIGILTEEYGGFYPTWLAPLQVIVINITDKQIDFVKKIFKTLCNVGIRVKVDLRNEKIAFKIREHTLRRVPYMLICGDKEIKLEKVSIRTCSGKNLGIFTIAEFIKRILNEIQTRSMHQWEEMKY